MTRQLGSCFLIAITAQIIIFLIFFFLQLLGVTPCDGLIFSAYLFCAYFKSSRLSLLPLNLLAPFKKLQTADWPEASQGF